ncbi:flagellar basal body P-ring biosynthesis protein FlgA [Brevundimonas diminuta]|uniref:flagellar basal body P-ring formation chaperone FlgA n=1 Tax=Brevundimonas diminuta TaxID=293 RepID=UPI000B4E129E|nr:flagellar basal body P-ring formation chaperone FlgA [Brevundimonas diminuta]OWR18822.1 flagella basal body P-ring formation protein FlgA [Brevundimonas diminuta]WQE44340.1 flagellar basal body P-ring formation chaperone FlgA [Brevundimonas diminuta]SPU43799.1 flagellar basal body P-ring biosynthesis protein FlgA [Brevundimonas diminuta]SUW16848.1 flagellar basal body P-ring biosynthesis protein FlgA [Brevundimonas diminuta]
MKRALILAAAVAAFAAPVLATQALAGPVNLLPDPVDDDGRITLGELFDDAGAASNVVVGRRAGATAVLEASQVQIAARRAGLEWSNPTGLRRIVVREGGALSGGALPAEASARPAAASVGAPARAGSSVEVLTYARSLAAGDVIQPEDVVWASVQSHLAPAGGPQDAEAVIGLQAKRALRAGSPVGPRDLASPQVIARNDMVEVAYINDGVELTVTGKATRNASAGEAVPILNVQSNRTIDAVAVAPGRAVAGPAAQIARRNPQQFAAR